MGYIKTTILLAALTALFMFAGFAIGGESGAMVAFLVAMAMNLFSYWNSDKIVLKMYRAKQVDRVSHPDLHEMVSRLAANAGLPMPKLYVIENDQPNAFATGRNPEHGAVAVTTGLLARLNDEETAGVVAHELAHIKNRDTLIMTITATIAGAISMLANFGIFFGGRRGDGRGNPIMLLLVMFLAPMAAMLVQMAISRTREYAADRAGSEICGNPLALASALEKIASSAARIDNDDAERNPATAHLFIINPLHARSIDNLFSTHPNTQNRIRALQELAQEMGVTQSFSSGQRAGGSGPWG